RNRYPAGAHPELDDRPACPPSLGDVEVDVLGHAPAPRVVELGDRVVRRRGHSGLRTTQTNSPLFSSNGVRSKSPYSASISKPATSIRASHSPRVSHQSEMWSPDSSVMSIRLSAGNWS